MEPHTKKLIEVARGIWSVVAKAEGWYIEPFHIQIWLTRDGRIEDTVSYKGMTKDIIIQLS